ncbi:MAG TPA: 4Fe-4S binding protein [Candidatus Methylomirabilis sp.]|nr:4Fe-4S binding protein [Candidatus Methylomirabilis sp.]
MRIETKVKLKELAPSIIVMIFFWIIAITQWQSSGEISSLYNFLYIGTVIGLLSVVFAILPRKKKPLGRKLTQIFIGGYLLIGGGLISIENFQIEGFFYYLMAGVISGAVIHYAVGKIFGPLLFGRAWCGWACWTAMILDILPFTRSSGRIPGKWGLLRYVHFILSLSIILLLWFGFGYRIIPGSNIDLNWFIAGNVIYFFAGITMAFMFKDNRAFCKYLCPITAFLKVTSRFSLIKIKGDDKKCNMCRACEKVCPMDIRISEYIKNGDRVLSTECILCETCVNTCPRETLKQSIGFDIGGKELLKEKQSNT